jgi:hypothetical protein
MKSSRSRSRSKNTRNRQPQGGNVVNRVFDSSGPEGKVRGTPQQVIEKYNQLARDAQLSNDRVAAENFQQHAEHYLRMLSEAQREIDQRREEQERQNRERQEEQDRQNRERQSERDRERAERQERDTANGGHNSDTSQSDDANTGDASETQGNDGAQSNQPSQDHNEQPKRRRNSRGPKPADAPQADVSSQDGEDDSNLVETPESKPKPRRAPRRKPQPKSEESSGQQASEGGDHTEAAE